MGRTTCFQGRSGWFWSRALVTYDYAESWFCRLFGICSCSPARSMMRIRLYLFLYFTGTVLLQFAYRSLDRLARGSASDWQVIVVEQATGVYGTAVLLPLLLWGYRRVPFWRSIFPCLEHALLLVLFSILHTSWNWGTRILLFRLFGLGGYDYGKMPLRYLMEFPADIITYVLAAGAYLVYRNWMRSRAIESELAMARLDGLTRQLQPHFLFNALNAVSGLMYEDVDRADLMLERICTFLRSTIRLPDSPLNSIANELLLARQYLEIMQTRFESKLAYSIQCDPKAEAIQIPTLLLQPLIENAVKYGHDPGSGDLNIQIDIELSDRRIEIRIRDHGSGLSPVWEGEEGQGLTNTKRRLASYYGGAAVFRLSAHAEGGAISELEIPA
ncbi:sensor histidine kinase [Granulicella sibirica]|uniref:Sensor histidine kinase n=1 Tax=Granulicella sibirica TaxID=2479048 RepID=A0A4Q0T8V1_9BACT|nr:histidine kinase [Granulicella sibirica]RXH58156.1 Sensor histidine kinase [Granulicella sibirica]